MSAKKLRVSFEPLSGWNVMPVTDLPRVRGLTIANLLSFLRSNNGAIEIVVHEAVSAANARITSF